MKSNLQIDQNNGEILDKLQFLSDQFALMFLKKKKYTFNTIIHAFLIYMMSIKCYNAIRNNILTLPHTRYLQKISSSFFISPQTDKENINFEKQIFNCTTEEENYVILQLD